MGANKSKSIHIVKVHPEKLRAFKATGAHGRRAKPSRAPAPTTAPLAPGFAADTSLNLKDFRGKTIGALSFANVYLGSSQWSASDMTNIDAALSGAMSDPALNNVIQQYFDAPITTTFLGRKLSDAAVPATYTRDSVSATLSQLYASGQLAGIDFSNTVVNLLLPPGVILDTTAASGVGDLDDKDSSLEGLGGYHGSHAADGGTTIYFAASVYSQTTAKGHNGIPVWPDSWKNVVATLYHELNEARTDADVEAVNRTNNQNLLGWYSTKGGEIGDIPINEAGDNLQSVFVEVALQSGQSAPIQLMWSNAAAGPGEPFTT
jgi:hypothetical protein